MLIFTYLPHLWYLICPKAYIKADCLAEGYFTVPSRAHSLLSLPFFEVNSQN